LELFARGKRIGWDVWGDQSEDYEPTWETYSYNSKSVNKDLSLIKQVEIVNEPPANE